MIRINLAKTHNYASSGTETAISSDRAAAIEGESTPQAKIAIMLVFTVLLYIYERYNLGTKQATASQISAQLEQVKGEIGNFGTVTSVVEDLVKEKEKLNAQLLIIQKISQKRAFKLKTILKVQENLPSDLWLTELIIDENEIEFKGLSRTPTSVQNIVAYLNDADYVDLAINQELKSIELDGETVNSFSILARVRK
ncbi:MAG: PilN domain-containing protein [Pseudomonadota bacterium]